MNWNEGPIWLASASPRRQQLLREAGIHAHVHPAPLDDAALNPEARRAATWVMAMAHLKARAAADELRQAQPGLVGAVLGADTVCEVNGRILGQPRDREDARAMLRLVRDAAHHTLTGVCLLSLHTADRLIFVDRARVIVGALTDAMIETYLESDGWRGKAGAYNLSERIDAGWPIRCEGDPATVMGLPIERLRGML